MGIQDTDVSQNEGTAVDVEKGYNPRTDLILSLIHI